MEKITLDKYQNKVVKNKSKNLLVIAGAGSGKTLTIVYKIKQLIKNKIHPNEILCITFTKAAAQNLEKKLLKENIPLNVKTFHSLGLEIIKNSFYCTVVKENTLDNIILKYLKHYSKLTTLINAPFIEFGNGNCQQLQNNILQNTDYIYYLKDTIKTFINLFKANNYPETAFFKFHQINRKENFYKTQNKHHTFLKLTQKLYLIYENHLKETKQIDFHDMLNKATEIVQKEGIKPYKYIIIDEYQDSSLNKCQLIQTIQSKTNANIMAVGDDWQSIYRFTGSNIEIFTNFKKYFPKAKIIKLKQAYRNSQQLQTVAKKFIMQNNDQINKTIHSKKKIKFPVYIYYYNNIHDIWDTIAKKTNHPTLVLGRNKKDIQKLPYLNQNMYYMTAHKSKGLEANQVIIINLENSVTGFPSKIKNSEYLKYVISNQENNYNEERRLFYVALTRTQNQVILLVNKQKPSLFVDELLKQSSKYIKIIDLSK